MGPGRVFDLAERGPNRISRTSPWRFAAGEWSLTRLAKIASVAGGESAARQASTADFESERGLSEHQAAGKVRRRSLTAFAVLPQVATLAWGRVLRAVDFHLWSLSVANQLGRKSGRNRTV